MLGINNLAQDSLQPPPFPVKPDWNAKIATDKRHSLRVLTSSKDNTWATPTEWFDYLNLEFGFTLDPCCEHETAKCQKHFTPTENGLAQSWADDRVFMNPPYDQIKHWMKKAYEESGKGALVVCSRARPSRYGLVAPLCQQGGRHSLSQGTCEVRGSKIFSTIPHCGRHISPEMVIPARNGWGRAKGN